MFWVFWFSLFSGFFLVNLLWVVLIRISDSFGLLFVVGLIICVVMIIRLVMKLLVMNIFLLFRISLLLFIMV